MMEPHELDLNKKEAEESAREKQMQSARGGVRFCEIKIKGVQNAK